MVLYDIFKQTFHESLGIPCCIEERGHPPPSLRGPWEGGV